MNPILNKKDFDDLSTNLRDLAHNYIEKYSHFLKIIGKK